MTTAHKDNWKSCSRNGLSPPPVNRKGLAEKPPQKALSIWYQPNLVIGKMAQKDPFGKFYFGQTLPDETTEESRKRRRCTWTLRLFRSDLSLDPGP